MKTPASSKKSQVASETLTRERVLDAAERLFAERGPERVSIRDITAAAGVNLGAVNYHFQSREKLIIAVFARCVSPLSQARLEALDKVEAAAGKKPPAVAEVLGAFIRPAVELALKEGVRATQRNRLLGRCMAESDPALQEWMRGEMEPLMKRFDGAIHRALPHLAREDVFWRMSFTFGAMNHLLMTVASPPPDWLKIKTGLQERVERLVEFACAGMCVPEQSAKAGDS